MHVPALDCYLYPVLYRYKWKLNHCNFNHIIFKSQSGLTSTSTGIGAHRYNVFIRASYSGIVVAITSVHTFNLQSRRSFLKYLDAVRCIVTLAEVPASLTFNEIRER